MEITAAAKAKIKEFLVSEPEGSVFCVRVNTGGCSGFQYVTEIELPRDDAVKLDSVAVGQHIVTDPMSHPMLKNVRLDYVDTIGHSGFTFENPDASSTCGCGISFDV